MIGQVDGPEPPAEALEPFRIPQPPRPVGDPSPLPYLLDADDQARGALAITLETACSKVQIGLPIQANLQTLPLAFETQAYGQGRTKNVNKVWLVLM